MLLNKMDEEDKKWEKIHEDYEKLRKEDGGEGGYFADLWKKDGGDEFTNNLKRLKFRKKVLNPYKEENQTRFILEKGGATIYLRDKMGSWDVRSICENEDSISVILVDIKDMPKNHQDFWREYLIEADD